MAIYRVEHKAVSSRTSVERDFEAHSDAAALALAAEIIAKSHDMPDAHVRIDQAAGQVTVGAGYRSRRGSFRLQQIETPSA